MKVQQRLTALLTLATLTTALGLPAIAEPIGRIKSMTGNVQLKRNGWSTFRPVATNAEFKLGDLLLPAANAKVNILCPDFTERPVRSGVQSGLKGVCPTLSRKAGRGPNPADGTLGGLNAQIPYIISPRRTLLLHSKPTLRWNPVTGAKQYTVQVIGPNGVVWQTKVKQPEVMYPGKPLLQPGVPYTLLVQTDTGASSKSDGASGLEFRVLRDSELKALQAEVTKLSQQDLTTSAVALTVANLYRNYALPKTAASSYGIPAEEIGTHNLSAEGIEILTALITKGNRSPAVYRMLGDLYWQIGLAQPAIAQYLKVIEFAAKPEELEDRTEAQFSLGEIYAATKDVPQAVRWYSQAKDGYGSLGDSQRVRFLEGQIQTLQSATISKSKKVPKLRIARDAFRQAFECIPISKNA